MKWFFLKLFVLSTQIAISQDIHIYSDVLPKEGPRFKDGPHDLKTYLNKHLNTVTIVKANESETRANLIFVVKKSGKLDSIKVTPSLELYKKMILSIRLKKCLIGNQQLLRKASLLIVQ